MKVNIYSVFDRKVGAYMRPWVASTDGEALRMFAAECRRADSNLSQFPEDFLLYGVGEFDDAAGLVSGCPKGVRQLATATEVLGLRTLETAEEKEG